MNVAVASFPVESKGSGVWTPTLFQIDIGVWREIKKMGFFGVWREKEKIFFQSMEKKLLRVWRKKIVQSMERNKMLIFLEYGEKKLEYGEK